MIVNILPAQVASEDTFYDAPETTLFPEERRLIQKAVSERRREVTTVRHCARRALARLGVPAAPILPGPYGAPVWPPSVVGSMTHCLGYRAAAVGLTSEVSAVGIDAEPNEPIPEGILEVIALPGEAAWITARRKSSPEVAWDRLLFSLKESVYKVWSPITREPLEFEDAFITVDPDRQTFTTHLLGGNTLPYGDQRLTTLTGRWHVANGLIVSALALAAPAEIRQPALAAAASGPSAGMP